MHLAHSSVARKIAVVATALLLVGVSIYILLGRSLFKPLSPAQEAVQIFEACKHVSGETGNKECTAKELAIVGERQGFMFMGDTLTAYQRTYANQGYRSYQDCHVLAHLTSHELASREPGKWKELIQQMNAGHLDPMRCGGGFLHGIIEVRATQDPNFKVNAVLYKELCTDTLPKEVSTSCAHILGHLALLEAYGKGYGLDNALTSCDGLSGDFLFQCYNGIFMEDSMRTNLAEHELASLPTRNSAWLETQVKRCHHYGDVGVIASSCWYDLPEVFLQTHHYDLVKTYAFCQTAPTSDARKQCYVRASYLVALTPGNLFQSSYTKELCAAYASKSKNLTDCMQQVIGAALSNSMSSLDRTVAFCGERPATAQGTCFDAIDWNIARVSRTPGEQGALCATLPAPYQEVCIASKPADPSTSSVPLPTVFDN